MAIVNLQNTERVALIDEDMVKTVSTFRWCITKNGYAYGYVHGRRVPLHRFIMGIGGPYIDHINRDRLDNRRENLRFCTLQQNLANAGPRKRNVSGFRGVTKHRRKWRAEITIDGKLRRIGSFLHAKDAAIAWNIAAREAWGEFAFQNST